MTAETAGWVIVGAQDALEAVDVLRFQEPLDKRDLFIEVAEVFVDKQTGVYWRLILDWERELIPSDRTGVEVDRQRTHIYGNEWVARAVLEEICRRRRR